MRTPTLTITAMLGLSLGSLSGTASAISCTTSLQDPGNPNNPTFTTTTYSADGTSACAGPINGNSPPYDLLDPNDSPDMGLGFTDWATIEKDNIGQNGEGVGFLQINVADGLWRYTGTDGYTELLLLIKGGNSFATFLISGSVNTWYSHSLNPPQSNGLSHMEIFGRNPGEDNDCKPGDTRPECNPPQVPEPGTLALLGLGLMGLAAARRRRSR